MRNRTNVFTNLDWVTILTYLVLVIIGWLSIYAAVYNEEHSKIFDLSQRYGNQLLWIGLSLLLALIILMIEGSFFTSFAYPIYGLIILMLIGVLLFGAEIKGAKSWFRIGSFAIQHAEFG
ncbi:MAG: FtsW/RodA/SpoVE family cell cycle protein, partial [Vicingaceae bacterium]|nr:FtsW/RodA/SpoVE family cell cycle protein [Vicingaceae bacterium]